MEGRSALPNAALQWATVTVHYCLSWQHHMCVLWDGLLMLRPLPCMQKGMFAL